MNLLHKTEELLRFKNELFLRLHDDPHEFKLDYYRGAGFHSVNRKYV